MSNLTNLGEVNTAKRNRKKEKKEQISIEENKNQAQEKLSESESQGSLEFTKVESKRREDKVSEKNKSSFARESAKVKVSNV